MQVELSLEDLRSLVDAATVSPDVNDDLMSRLEEWRDEAEELADLDFNECEGGACKL